MSTVKKQWLLCMLLSISFLAGRSQSADELRGVEMKSSVSFLGPDTMNAQVYHYKDMTMYRFSYRYDSSAEEMYTFFEQDDSTATAHHSSDTIHAIYPSTSLCSETRFHFVVYKNADEHGYNYDNNRPVKASKVSLDSVFKWEWAKSTDIYESFLCNKPVLVSEQQNPDSGTINQVYEIRDTADNSDLATYYLSFSDQLKDIEASLSTSLDNRQHSKLYKVLLVAHPAAFKRCGSTMNEMSFYYSLERITAPNREEIMGYFNRFEKDNASLSPRRGLRPADQ